MSKNSSKLITPYFVVENSVTTRIILDYDSQLEMVQLLRDHDVPIFYEPDWDDLPSFPIAHFENRDWKKGLLDIILGFLLL